MKNKPILIDVSLTGGRGPAKKVKELILDLKANSLPFEIITDRLFALKLHDCGIKPTYIVDTDMSEKDEVIIAKFQKTLETIDFLFLVKIGARVAGPIAARKMKKNYILVDGGLPDYLTDQESLYERKTFELAKKVLITSQFPWRPPERTGLKNIAVCGFPISQETFNTIDSLKTATKKEIIQTIISRLKYQRTINSSNLLINLLMTGDCCLSSSRKTYGGYLTARQYDQCIGFTQRLITDLGEKFPLRLGLFIGNQIAGTIGDLIDKYPKINLITFKRGWDFDVELKMQAAADINISRATNYQPFIAALNKQCNITTPVPADGYMDEDQSAVQYAYKKLTKYIPYDQDDYIEKVKNFWLNKQQQAIIKNNLKKNEGFLHEKNLNHILINEWQQLTTLENFAN